MKQFVQNISDRTLRGVFSKDDIRRVDNLIPVLFNGMFLEAVEDTGADEYHIFVVGRDRVVCKRQSFYFDGYFYDFYIGK